MGAGGGCCGGSLDRGRQCLNLRIVASPSYNADQGPISIFTARAHVELSSFRNSQAWRTRMKQEAMEIARIRACEEHDWMQDSADLHARERTFSIARRDSPKGTSPDEALAAIVEVLGSISTVPTATEQPGR